MKVLVAGGTGRLGRLVVEHLVGEGVGVRVLTRDRRRAEPLQRLGVDVVDGDVRRLETLSGAVDGVDVVVSAVQGFAGPGRVTPASVDRDGNANLVDAAARADAAVVMVSIVGAAADNPLELARCKYAAERHLRGSGAPWTIVRCSAFAELWAELVVKGVVFGAGDNPINFVSVHDVAPVVTAAVVDPGYRSRVVDVAGPTDLTFNQLASLLREQRGQPARVRHVPRRVLRALAPLHRQPRAGYVMDTADMTYRPRADSVIGSTDIRLVAAAQRD